MTSPLHRKAGNIDVKELLSEPYTGTDLKGQLDFNMKCAVQKRTLIKDH